MNHQLQIESTKINDSMNKRVQQPNGEGALALISFYVNTVIMNSPILLAVLKTLETVLRDPVRNSLHIIAAYLHLFGSVVEQLENSFQSYYQYFLEWMEIFHLKTLSPQQLGNHYLSHQSPHNNLNYVHVPSRLKKKKKKYLLSQKILIMQCHLKYVQLCLAIIGD